MTRVLISAAIIVSVFTTTATEAHPGDGVFVTPNGDIYFGSTFPIMAPVASHYGALWRFTKAGQLELVYRSKYNASNIVATYGLDGSIYFQETHFLGEGKGRGP